jgi:uncharacterized protein YdaU (DUF1376 family)
MSKRPTIEIWMPLHFADITKACSRMSELEECAFLRLLRDQWLNGPTPADDATLARTVRLPLAKWRKVRPVLQAHFDLTGGVWVHEPTMGRRQHAMGVSEAKRRGANGGANATPNAPPNADIRDLSSSFDRLVNTHPSQEGSKDSKVSSSADVIPLPTRTGR